MAENNVAKLRSKREKLFLMLFQHEFHETADIFHLSDADVRGVAASFNSPDDFGAETPACLVYQDTSV